MEAELRKIHGRTSRLFDGPGPGELGKCAKRLLICTVYIRTSMYDSMLHGEYINLILIHILIYVTWSLCVDLRTSKHHCRIFAVGVLYSKCFDTLLFEYCTSIYSFYPCKI